jgi:hypothetical protein
MIKILSAKHYTFCFLLSSLLFFVHSTTVEEFNENISNLLAVPSVQESESEDVERQLFSFFGELKVYRD